MTELGVINSFVWNVSVEGKKTEFLLEVSGWKGNCREKSKFNGTFNFSCFGWDNFAFCFVISASAWEWELEFDWTIYQRLSFLGSPSVSPISFNSLSNSLLNWQGHSCLNVKFLMWQSTLIYNPSNNNHFLWVYLQTQKIGTIIKRTMTSCSGKYRNDVFG